MKSFTDIEQSKKLEEILPVESADMWYWEWPTAPSYNNYEHPMFHKGEDIHNVPCWSTQALLDEIPYTWLNKDNEDLKLHIEKDGEQYYLFYENEYTGDMFEIETDMYDDLVDACVEMILKLIYYDSKENCSESNM